MPVSKKPRKKAKSKNKSQGDNVIGFVPNARDIEAFLGDILDDDNSQDPVQKAQSVMYEAWECSDPKQRFTLARKALRISPLCADAYNLLAEEYAKTQERQMGFQPRADLQNQAIGWLQRGYGSLDGGTGYDLCKPGGHLGNVG